MKDKLKGVVKSKTMYLSMSLATLTPVLDNFPEVRELLADNYGWAFLALSGLVAYLRFVTTKSLGEK